jgi:hypothetical protein
MNEWANQSVPHTNVGTAPAIWEETGSISGRNTSHHGDFSYFPQSIIGES